MSTSSKKNLNTTQIILIIGFIVLFIVIGVASFFIIKAQKNSSISDSVVPSGNLVIDESNLAEVEEELTARVEKGSFELNMNTIWNFPDGKSASSDAYLANGHANSLPLTFEILLNGTDEIYTSTVIPVGQQIREIVLDKDLDAGVYNAVCMYHLWNEDATEDSSFGVNVILNILE